MKVFRVGVLLGLVTAGHALACEHGRGGFSLNFGTIPLSFSIHTHARRAPVVVSAPPVYVQPQYQYVQPVVVSAPPVVMTPPPIVTAPPPVVYVQAPAVMTPPPLPAPAPAPVAVAAPVVAPPTVAARAEARDSKPALLAVKYLPGFNTWVDPGVDSVAVGGPSLSHTVGVELRLSNWFALRSDFEARSAGRSWDVIGAKLSIPGETFAPYVSGGLSASEPRANRGHIQLGFTGSAGLDVKFGKHFFLEGEARYRLATDSCCRDPGQVTVMVGAGVALL